MSWLDPGAHTESPSDVGDEKMTAISRVGGGEAPADKVVTRDHRRWRRLETRSGSWEERGGAPSPGGDDLSGERIETHSLFLVLPMLLRTVPHTNLERMDHDAENVALQRPLLKESVPVEPMGSQKIASIPTLRQQDLCWSTSCRQCGRQNGVGKVSDSVMRKCTSCDQGGTT